MLSSGIEYPLARETFCRWASLIKNVSLCRINDSLNHFNTGRFPRAVGPQQPKANPRSHREINPSDRMNTPRVDFFKIFNLQNGLKHARRLVPDRPPSKPRSTPAESPGMRAETHRMGFCTAKVSLLGLRIAPIGAIPNSTSKETIDVKFK